MLIKLLPQILAFDSLEGDQFIPHFIDSDFNCIGHSWAMESVKASRFSVSDKQKDFYEKSAVSRSTKKSLTKTWLRAYL